MTLRVAGQRRTAETLVAGATGVDLTLSGALNVDGAADFDGAVDMSAAVTLSGSARLTLPAGLITDLPLRFTGSTDDGIYHDGTNVRIVINGAVVASWTAGTTALTGSASTSSGMTVAGLFALTGDVTPTGLDGTTVDNWAAVTATTALLRTAASAATIVRGMSGGTDGRLVAVENIETTAGRNITFNNEDATATAANRYILPNAAALVVPPGGCALFVYDSTSSRWRLLAKNF